MEKRQIKVSDVLALLEQGKDRAAIKQELDLTHAEMAALFQHSKLKNKKPKVQASFILFDDTEDVVASVETNTPVAEAVAQTIAQTVDTPTSEVAPEPATKEVKVQEGVW